MLAAFHSRAITSHKKRSSFNGEDGMKELHGVLRIGPGAVLSIRRVVYNFDVG